MKHKGKITNGRRSSPARNSSRRPDEGTFRPIVLLVKRMSHFAKPYHPDRHHLNVSPSLLPRRGTLLPRQWPITMDYCQSYTVNDSDRRTAAVTLSRVTPSSVHTVEQESVKRKEGPQYNIRAVRLMGRKRKLKKRGD
uniref:Uncharacterized protein n=1 Tax=Trichuris muris TaxID=70415 RepID=A0A5S6QWA4_TRIMR